MMQDLLNHGRRVAQEAMSDRATTRHGTVDGYDPNNYAVRVKLQPDGTLTDWIPLKSAFVGNGWGLFLAPSIGDAVEVDFQEGDAGVGSAGWRFFNNADRPLNVPTGEAWLVHKSGSFVKLTTDGKITLTDAHGTILALDNAGNVAITGNVTVTGTIVAQGEVTGNGKHLSTHVHSGGTISGDTGAPV
jgi:phage baseplate assembly protein gpV